MSKRKKTEVDVKELTSKRRIEKHRCCICGKVFEGYGNNPIPCKMSGRCCDDCNSKYVIPSKLERLRKGQSW